VLEEVRAELESRRETGQVDAAVFRDWLAGFRYLDDEAVPEPRALIVVSVPRPTHAVTFTRGDDAVETLLPPTYVGYNGLFDRVAQALRSEVLGPRHRLVRLAAPLKAVAARLGLVKYGRNNIAYGAKAGSYQQLVGYLTDAAVETVPPREPEMLAACLDCRACVAACPTGAIPDDRFLLHAERCLALFTETAGDFPSWLPDRIHHCLVGCLICQRVCPANAGRFRVEPAGLAFDATETDAIVADGGERTAPVWEGIREKLAAAGLADYEPVLARNLQALLRRAR
jgi:epoxyqueuosine reductase